MKRKYGSTKVPYEFLKGNLGIPADCNIDSVQNIQNRRLIEIFILMMKVKTLLID